MSSDSSEISKSIPNEKALKPNSDSKSRKKSQSSKESDGKKTSMGSVNSHNSVKNFQTLPKVTVLEQLNFKKAAVDLYHTEDLHKGTATSHNSTTPTVITAVLKDLQDDIVQSPDYKHAGPVALVNGDRAIAVIGGDNIYVQGKTKFIPVPRDKALPNHQDNHFWAHHASKLEDYSSLDVALLVQKVFIPISSMCFGLLGGVALLQLLLVHYLVGESSEQDQKFFLQSYSKLAEITPLLFYILLTVCIVSVLDRVPTQQENTKCQQSWIIVAVYALTLILSLTCASYDDMFSLYHQNKTLFHDQMKTQEIVSDWKLLNTLRCLLAVTGWILFSLKNPPDFFLQYLLQIKQYENQKQQTPVAFNNSLA